MSFTLYKYKYDFNNIYNFAFFIQRFKIVKYTYLFFLKKKKKKKKKKKLKN